MRSTMVCLAGKLSLFAVSCLADVGPAGPLHGKRRRIR